MWIWKGIREHWVRRRKTRSRRRSYTEQSDVHRSDRSFYRLFCRRCEILLCKERVPECSPSSGAESILSLSEELVHDLRSKTFIGRGVPQVLGTAFQNLVRMRNPHIMVFMADDRRWAAPVAKQLSARFPVLVDDVIHLEVSVRAWSRSENLLQSLLVRGLHYRDPTLQPNIRRTDVGRVQAVEVVRRHGDLLVK